jgi:tetratricopeptide (TPR) repeat protein
MPTFEDYWSGKDLAEIESNSSEWDGAARQEWLKIIKFSFEVFQNARTNIKQCPDYNRQKALNEDLESCANEGCSRFLSGVLGLKEAFEHLAKNKGRWCDPIGRFQLMPFYHEQPWSLYKPYWHHGHRAGVRFMEAFDNKTKEGLEAVAKMQSQAEELKNKTEHAEKLTARESGAIAKTLETIKAASDKVEQVLWWTSQAKELDKVKELQKKIPAFKAAVEKYEKYAHIAETINKPISEVFEKADKVTDKIGEACENYQRAKEINPQLTDGEAASIAILQKAMEYVPVFGTLYAEVIGGIPNTTAMVQQHADDLKEAMQRLF